MELHCKSGLLVILSLVLFLLLIHFSHQQLQSQEVRICPSRGELENKCVPLSQVAFNTAGLIRSHSVIKFYPGKYSLYSLMTVQDVQNISFIGTGSTTPNIVCIRRDSGIALLNVNGILISNLTFSNCGFNGSYFKPNTKVWSSFATFIILDSHNLIMEGVVVQHGKGYSVSGVNILGNSTIMNSVFTNMTEGGGFHLLYENTPAHASEVQHNITFVSSQFTENSQCLRRWCSGAGVAVVLRQNSFAVSVHFLGVQVCNNRAGQTAGIILDSASPNPNHLLIEKSVFRNNSVFHTGSSGFSYIYTSFLYFTGVSNTSQTSPEAVIEINDSNFTENIGVETHIDPDEKVSSMVINFAIFAGAIATPHFGSVRGCIVANNVGGRSVALYVGVVNNLDHQDNILRLEVIGSQFVNNTSTAYINFKRSIVEVKQVQNATFFECFFANNSGTALLVDMSKIYFKSANIFLENKAYNGAGLGLYGDTAYLYLHSSSTTTFVRNQAENTGGGIYVARTTETVESTHCFLQFYGFDSDHVYNSTVSLRFSNNSAKMSGNDLFGGGLSTCYVDLHSYAGWKQC